MAVSLFRCARELCCLLRLRPRSSGVRALYGRESLVPREWSPSLTVAGSLVQNNVRYQRSNSSRQTFFERQNRLKRDWAQPFKDSLGDHGPTSASSQAPRRGAIVRPSVRYRAGLETVTAAGGTHCRRSSEGWAKSSDSGVPPLVSLLSSLSPSIPLLPHRPRTPRGVLLPPLPSPNHNRRTEIGRR